MKRTVILLAAIVAMGHATAQADQQGPLGPSPALVSRDGPPQVSFPKCVITIIHPKGRPDQPVLSVSGPASCSDLPEIALAQALADLLKARAPNTPL